MLEKHFVTFYSPGTFVCEETTRPIKTWDVDEATTMAGTIKERHGATPFAFEFSTRRRRDDELDSKVFERSNRYYLSGKVLTLAQVIARENPKDAILISNMRGNRWDRVIENNGVTQPLEASDTVLHSQ